MKLDKKKLLAARAFGVGKERITFIPSRLSEISEAITRQDFLNLLKERAIQIHDIHGRRKVKKKKKKGSGKIRKKIRKRKRNYVLLTRKLRGYLKELLKQGKIDHEKYRKMRELIKSRAFKNKSHLQSFIK